MASVEPDLERPKGLRPTGPHDYMLKSSKWASLEELVHPGGVASGVHSRPRLGRVTAAPRTRTGPGPSGSGLEDRLRRTDRGILAECWEDV